MDEKRNIALDALKGSAMFIVVLIHVFQRTIPNFVSYDHWWSQILYLLCVPIFFYLSGISYSNKKELSIKEFSVDILKRAFMYFWPFLFFILLRIWIYGQWNSLAKAFEELMEYPVSGLWVCWVLLFITLTLDVGLLISKLYPKLKKLFVFMMFAIGIVVIVTLRNVNVINSDHFIGYNYFVLFTPVFFAGYLVGDKYFQINKPIISYLAAVLCLAGLVTLCYYRRKFMGVYFYDDLGYNYLAALLSVGTYLGIIELFKSTKKLTNLVAVSGKYTLELYFVHLMLLKAFHGLFYDSWAISLSVIMGLLLLSYASTAVIILITYYVPFLHFLLFGKHFSKYEWEDRLWKAITFKSKGEVSS